jgi:hypothetical protein
VNPSQAQSTSNGHLDAIANGDVVALERAAVRRLHARELNVEHSAIGAARAERTTLTRSSAALVVSRSVASDESRIGVLVAPVVRGDVHTLVDMRSALAIGVGMALGRALLAGGHALAGRMRS